jgi:hypothetical protein
MVPLVGDSQDNESRSGEGKLRNMQFLISPFMYGTLLCCEEVKDCKA